MLLMDFHVAGIHFYHSNTKSTLNYVSHLLFLMNPVINGYIISMTFAVTFLTPGLLTVLSKHRAISYDNFGDNMKMQLWVAWTWRIFCLAAKNFKYILKSLLSQYLGWIMTTLEPCKCYVYWWYLLCGN